MKPSLYRTKAAQYVVLFQLQKGLLALKIGHYNLQVIAYNSSATQTTKRKAPASMDMLHKEHCVLFSSEGVMPTAPLLRDDCRLKNGCFFGKLPNGLDPPPPRPFLEITLRFFPENLLSMRKFAMTFFGLAMTPPLPPFLQITLRFVFLQNILL